MVSEKALAAALRNHDGIKSFAASEVGITRQAMQARVDNSPKLQALLRDLDEEILDLGEGHVLKGVRTGDKDYVRMVMTQKGRKRGYGNKVETSLDEAQLEAIVTALGGDAEALRSALLRLGVDPDQT